MLAGTGGELTGCIHCGECTRACPGNAIRDGRIDKEKCLSYITQKKGELTEEEKRMIKESGCIWGCDICQNVCPLNKGAGKTDINEFRETAVPRAESDTRIEGRAFAWRGEKVIKRNIDLQEDR